MYNVLRLNRKSREDHYHCANDCIHRLSDQWNFDVNIEAPESFYNALKNTNEGILAFSRIVSYLCDISVTMAHRKVLMRIRTERVTPATIQSLSLDKVASGSI